MPDEDRDAAQALAERLEAALQPLADLRDGGEQELADYAVCLTRVLEALAAGEDGAPTALYAEEAGAALRDMLRAFVAAPETGFAFRAPELPDVALALMRSINVRPARRPVAARLHLGALEARLQNVDVMILGGLNEGTWPGTARSDAFLSRIMRSEIELDPARAPHRPCGPRHLDGARRRGAW